MKHTKPIKLALSLAALLTLLSGCLSGTSEAEQTLTIEVRNIGTRALSTVLDVKDASGKTILHQTFETPAKQTTSRTTDLVELGTYDVSGKWAWSEVGLGGSGDDALSVNTADCRALRKVVVTFTIDGSDGISFQPAQTNCNGSNAS